METQPPADVPRIAGLVLCRVGSARMAFAATDVTAIDAPRTDSPWAGRCFGLTGQMPPDARLLWHEQGGVVVDSVEVFPDSAVLLPVPAAVARVMGGAVAGFVEAVGQLWPVVAIDGLVQHLKGAPP